jgi:hypothetical protein
VAGTVVVLAARLLGKTASTGEVAGITTSESAELQRARR